MKLIVKILVLLLISSCKKENEVDSLSEIQKLTSKKWKLTALTYKTNGKTEDLFASSPKCKIDDVLVFTQNGNSEEGTFYFEEKELCPNQVINTTKSIWKKSSKGIELFLTDNSGLNMGSVFLKKLTSTTLIFEVYPDSDSVLERKYSSQ
jgi:hypothetical protein